MIKLLFTVPVSNAKVERMFFKLNHAKVHFHCSFVVKRLENTLRIMKEGSSWETFDPISVIKEWNTDKIRHTTEEKGPHS